MYLAGRRLAFVLGCALLASCGGGDGGSSPPPTGGGGGTPTPSPTPSPTPTPTYQTVVQLTGNQTFATSCATYNFDPTISPNFGATSAFQFGEGFQLRFTDSNDSWSFIQEGSTGPGSETTFTFAPGDIVANPPANTVLYRRMPAGSLLELALRNGQQTGFTTDYLRTSLFTNVAAAGPQGSARLDSLCVYGVPTVAADTFPSATATYSSINVSGTATLMNSAQRVTTFSLRDSTATFSLNGQTNTVTMSIQLVGREIMPDGSLSNTTTMLPAITAGSGMVANRGTPSVRTFDGNFTTGGIQELRSGFAGAFFGPQGSEVGFSFRAYPLTNNPNESYEIAGIVVARR